MIIAINTLIHDHRTCFATTSLHKPSKLKSCWTERRIVHCVALLFCMILMVSFFSTAASAQSYTWNNAVTSGGGGFIPGIIFNPTQQNLIYARTDIGGAYRWDQASQRWIPLMDWVGFNDWNTLGVESIATDPIDPTRFYVAAGTYTNSFTTANGAILRSTDQGNTFQRTNLPFKLGGNMPGRSMGERLVVDPNLNSILFFGARSGNGLWKSTDFGVTWSKVAGFTAMATYVELAGDVYRGDTDGIAWVTSDPRSSARGTATKSIYAGIADKGNSIFHSADGGATWTAIPGQPTGFLPHHGVLSSDGFLYITYSNGAGPYDGTSGDVWKFSTSTSAWTKISPIPSTDASNDYFGYGGLAIDALHPQTIMVSALNAWWPDTIFFRSTDGGTTWTRIWSFTSYPSRSLRYTQDISLAPWLNFGDTNPIAPVPSPKLGWMVDAVAIDPFNSDHMLYGTGATLYGTTNLSGWDTSTMNISVKSQGVEEAAVNDLISPPSGAHLYSALGDISGFRHDDLTVSPPVMYSVPFAGSYTSIDYAELSPAFIARVGNGNPTASPAIRSSAFSFDGGSNWFQGNNDPAGLGTNGGGTIAAAADASRVVWNPNGLGAFFSTDNGNSWTASSGLPAGGRVASDRVNPKKFYAFSSGKFYTSVDGGVTFTASTATGLPAVGDPVRFKAVPGHEGDIWLAGGSTGSGVYGLWHSTNNGANFTKLANVDQADTVGLGMAAPGQTYPAIFTSAQVGGVRGIFRSDDAGASWIRINDDQHQWGSTNATITGDPRIYGRVYLGTNGRGIIYGDLNAAPPTPNFSLSASPSSLAINRGASGTSTITITRTGGFAGAVTFTAAGLPSGVTASFSPATTTTTGASSVLTFTASTTAVTGAATITITGASGTVSHSATISLTVNAPATPNFTIAASPAAVSINRGATSGSTITITPSGGFTGSVALSVSGLPAGVTAAFSPASTTGTSALTFTASSTATLGAATVTITGTSGTITHTTSISLTVNAPVTGTGGVTTTATVNSSGAFFNDQSVKLSNTAPITALSLTINIQATTGVTFNGQFNTVGTQITQSHSSTATAITYQFGLAAGQTLGAGTNWVFDAQTSGNGTIHPTTGDTFTVTYTTGGQTFTQTGHF